MTFGGLLGKPETPDYAAYRRWATLQAGLPANDDGWDKLSEADQVLLEALTDDDVHRECMFLVDPRSSLDMTDRLARSVAAKTGPKMSLADFALFCNPLVIHDPDKCTVPEDDA